jgi:hypothetical protein
MSEKAIRNKSDWDDDKDEDGPSPFWPDAVEFKDMLLDESQWRAGLIGIYIYIYIYVYMH